MENSNIEQRYFDFQLVTFRYERRSTLTDLIDWTHCDSWPQR